MFVDALSFMHAGGVDLATEKSGRGPFLAA